MKDVRKNYLFNKVAIVLGSSRGIGKAIAHLFSKEGAKVVLTGNAHFSLAQTFKDELQKEGYEALAYSLDITQRKEIQNLYEDVIQKWGSIDILVTNAGIFEQKSFEALEDQEWDQMFSVNMKGTFIASQEAFRYMKSQKSGQKSRTIIHMTSGAGYFGSTKAIHYASSKGALITFTRSLAKLAAPYHIRVNSIAPGYIQTDMTRDMLKKDQDKILNLIPLKRIGEPQDVARVALFLASDLSSYMTGQIINVDGGDSLL